MPKSLRITLILSVLGIISVFIFMRSCVIYLPKPQDCEIVKAKIISIKEGSSFDFVFFNQKGEYWYINRGLEQGLNLDSLNVTVLNKTVTLHLPKMLYGVSNHIAQLAIEDNIIFTEFD